MQTNGVQGDGGVVIYGKVEGVERCWEVMAVDRARLVEEVSEDESNLK